MDRIDYLLDFLDRLIELKKDYSVPEEVVKAVVNEVSRILEIKQ